MNARELGRQAAILRLKMAASIPPPAPSLTPGVPGLGSSETYGSRPNSVAAPALPASTAAPVPPVPPPPQPGTTATPPAAGGISGMLGNMAGGLGTAQGLGGILANPAIKRLVQPALQTVGLPGLAAGTDFFLNQGANVKNLLSGPIGSGNAKP